MAIILRLISGIYLVLVWTIFVMVVFFMPGSDPSALSAAAGFPTSSGVAVFLMFLAAIALSIPAIALYAFGQVVGDVRLMTDHLGAMRRYYEPRS